MKKVNIYEAKTRLSQLVDEAASGRDVIIARTQAVRLCGSHGCSGRGGSAGWVFWTGDSELRRISTVRCRSTYCALSMAHG